MNEKQTELERFAHEIAQSVISRAESAEEGAFREAMFTEIALELLGDAGEVEDGVVCQHRARGIQVSGYAIAENGESMDLVITHYVGSGVPETVGKTELGTAFKRLTEFFNKSKNGYYKEIEESGAAFDLSQQLYNGLRGDLSVVRFILVTNGVVKTEPPKDKDLDRVRINFDVWDIERFHRLVSSGRQREAIEINFVESVGEAIPCLSQATQGGEYATYLSIFPAVALVEMYGKYGARLLERNVRSFLQARGKINAGIRDTIRKEPAMFLAFNNGLSATADSVELVKLPDGGRGIKSIRDLQIVNGGQTTASIYHAVKRDKADVSNLFVQVKLTVLNDLQKVDEVIPLISRYANSQNKIQEADLAANDKYHRELETLSRTIWAPAKDGAVRETRWYYERARKQYDDELSRAATLTKIRAFQSENPKDQLFTKTDLAKALVTWDMHPHVVSKGAQACFTWFMAQLPEHLAREGGVCDQDYFERLTAKIILFRSAERIIKDKSMGFTGYYANLVTYSIARLVHETKGWIDLGRVWKEQRISPVLEDAIRDLSRSAFSHITNTNSGQGNVTQYCKMAKCWDGYLLQIVPLPDGLQQATLSGGNRTKPRGVATAKGVVAQENIQRILGVPAEEWFAMLSWARAHALLNGLQRKIIVDIATSVGGGLVPSPQQAIEGVKILDAVQKAGYIKIK